MVFQKDADVAVKVSITGLRSIVKEATVLRHLQTDDRSKIVPEFVSSGHLEVTIGGVEMKLSSFEMKPVDHSIYSIWSMPQERAIVVEFILMDISSALEFIHNKGVSHNDVNDRNIVLHREKQQWRAILADCSMHARCIGGRKAFKAHQLLLTGKFVSAMNGFPFLNMTRLSEESCPGMRCGRVLKEKRDQSLTMNSPGANCDFCWRRNA